MYITKNFIWKIYFLIIDKILFLFVSELFTKLTRYDFYFNKFI